MKKRQIVKIDDKEISIKELTIKELIFLCHRAGWVSNLSDMGLEKMSETYKDIPLQTLILSFASDLTIKDIIAFAPSELQVIYNEFVKINEVTFDTAKFLGIDKVLEDLKTKLIREFLLDYSLLLKTESRKIQPKVENEE